MRTAESQDTEITLGTGKMLGLFFALVIVCAAFFGMGFSVGKNSAKAGTDDSAALAAPKVEKRPSAAESVSSTPKQSPDMTFYKSVGQKDANSELSSSASTASSPEAKDNT